MYMFNVSMIWIQKYSFDYDITILFISQGNCYTKSTAILEIFKILGGIWLLLLIFRYIPLRVRDKLYDWIAKNRYKLFGKRTTCSIPPPRYQDRFLK